MNEKIIASGFGGQGVILIGQIISYTALKKGCKATWIPSYGPEMRGGTANCSFIISETEIGSPIVNEPTVLICMNQPSLDKFGPLVKPGGTVLYNSNLVKDTLNRADVTMRPVPANDIANELGNAKLQNMAALGAFLYQFPELEIEEIMESLEEKMAGSKRTLLELNRKAIEAGFRHAKEQSAQS